MHIREQSGLGHVLAPSGTPPNYAYTRQKWTWARAGLWTPPCGTPSELCIYASEMDLGLYKGPLDKL